MNKALAVTEDRTGRVERQRFLLSDGNTMNKIPFRCYLPPKLKRKIAKQSKRLSTIAKRHVSESEIAARCLQCGLGPTVADMERDLKDAK